MRRNRAPRRLSVANEVLGDGKVRSHVPDGFNWPLGLAVGVEGEVFAADGPYFYQLRAGAPRDVADALHAGLPG